MPHSQVALHMLPLTGLEVVLGDPPPCKHIVSGHSSLCNSAAFRLWHIIGPGLHGETIGQNPSIPNISDFITLHTCTERQNDTAVFVVWAISRPVYQCNQVHLPLISPTPFQPLAHQKCDTHKTTHNPVQLDTIIWS